MTRSSYRGYTLHLRAAEQLRALLGCRRTENASSRDEAEARVFFPPPGFVQRSDPFSSVWVGLCCGSLVGMAIYTLGMLTIGGAKGSDPVDNGAVIFGAGGGALAGAALMLYLRRARPPR